MMSYFYPLVDGDSSSILPELARQLRLDPLQGIQESQFLRRKISSSKIMLLLILPHLSPLFSSLSSLPSPPSSLLFSFLKLLLYP